MEKFYLDEYLKSNIESCTSVDFQEACRFILDEFNRTWETGQSQKELLSLQKRAIVGYEKEKAYFERRIHSLLMDNGKIVRNVPSWYKTAEEGIYHELWGVAGVAEWFSNEMKDSTSAKIIGDNIYFMIDGKVVLMPQKISKERREQLVRAFLLANSDENGNKDIHHLYLLDGTRVTVYKNRLTKKNQEVIVFRRYIVRNYTFEEQARRGTIPENSIPLFKDMVKLGFNCAFVGQIRSAKTTFLATWQSYENEELEGVLIETDPEIPIHNIMPKAPIMQLIADGDELRNIVKLLMRSDADYFVIGEARDGVALETALKVADRGGRRLKMTFHIRRPEDFPYYVADEIANSLGGDVERLALRAADAFDYVFFFSCLEDKNQKRLVAIYEMSSDRQNKSISMEPICVYDKDNNMWKWRYVLDNKKAQQAALENKEIFADFDMRLKYLSGGKEE